MSLNVTNTAPATTDPDPITVEHGETAPGIDLSLYVSDADGDALSIEIVEAPVHGSVLFNSATQKYEYTADWGYRGTDSFKFRGYDGAEYSAPGTVFVQVTNRILELNDISDAIDDLANQILAAVNAGNGLGDLWSDIEDMTDALGESNHVLFHEAREDFDTHLTNYGSWLDNFNNLANDVVDKAEEAIGQSQGDKFRIKGIFDDLRALDEILETQQYELEDVAFAYAAIMNSAAGAGINFSNHLQNMEATLANMEGKYNSIQAIRDEIDGILNGVVPNASNNATIQLLNGLSDDIDNLFSQMAAPEADFYS